VKTQFRSKGTPDQWARACGRYVLAIAAWPSVACCLCRAIVTPGNMESGLLSLPWRQFKRQDHGAKLAASVYGGASYLQRWRPLITPLKPLRPAQRLLLILDELAQIDPKTRRMPYMLANEQARPAATRTGTATHPAGMAAAGTECGGIGLA